MILTMMMKMLLHSFVCAFARVFCVVVSGIIRTFSHAKVMFEEVLGVVVVNADCFPSCFCVIFVFHQVKRSRF